MHCLWQNIVWWLARDKEQKISKMTNVLLRLAKIGENTPAGTLVEIDRVSLVER